MSNKSDTPQTDADHELCKAVPGDAYRGFVTLAFARNLERQLNAALKNKGVCEWKQNEDGQYETHCNNVHEFIDASITPEDNGYVFCPYCGKEIEVEPPPMSAQDIADEKGDREYQARKDMMCGPDQPDIERGPW